MTEIAYGTPNRQHAVSLTQLVQRIETLDTNSGYLYALMCTHFANYCAIALQQNALIGFVTAYPLPTQPSTLFVWQIGVCPSARGKGIARGLLNQIQNRPWFAHIREVQCTIDPLNPASRALFSRWAQELSGLLTEQPFFTALELGANHPPEPLISITLPAPPLTQSQEEHPYGY
jgi:L-2,4-diaminobutyric acid acetyltransferase